MSSVASSGRILSSGLRKALVEECADLFDICTLKIARWSLLAPQHKLGWRKGSFSWLFVREVEYWTNDFFWRIEAMAVKNSKQPRSGNRSMADYTFVRCELTVDDKKKAVVWIEKNSKEMPAKVHDLLASDYKISLSHDNAHDTFIASATGKEGAVNQFKTLTSRHREWGTALFSLLYKHEVIFDSGVWETDDSENDGWS